MQVFTASCEPVFAMTGKEALCQIILHFKGEPLDGKRISNCKKILASLRGKGLRKRDGQIGPVNPSPPRGSLLTSKIWYDMVLDRVK